MTLICGFSQARPAIPPSPVILTVALCCLGLANEAPAAAPLPVDLSVSVLGPRCPLLPVKRLSRPRLALSPDGRTLATSGDEPPFDNPLPITIWDLSLRAPVCSLDGHTDRVRGLSFSPDGRLLASASWDGRLRIWSVRERREAGKALRKGGFNGCRFLSDKLLAAWFDSTIRLFDAPSLEAVRTLDAGGDVTCVDASTDGAVLAALAGTGLRFWNPGTGEPIKSPLGARKDIKAFALSPGGRLVLAGHDGGALRVWDWRRGLLVRLLHQGETRPEWVAWSHDGKTVAGTSFSRLRFWSADDWGEYAHSGCLIYGTPGALALAPDGAFVVTGEEPREYRVWPIFPKPAHGPRGARGPLHCLAYSPDGRRLAAGGDEGVAYLWDLEKGRVERTFAVAGEGTIWRLQFSSGGLAAGYGGGLLASWDVATGRLRAIEDLEREKWGRRLLPLGGAEGRWVWREGARLGLCAVGERTVRSRPLGPTRGLDEWGHPLRLVGGALADGGRTARLLWEDGVWEERDVAGRRCLSRFRLPDRPDGVFMSSSGSRLVSWHQSDFEEVGLFRFWVRSGAGWRETPHRRTLPTGQLRDCAFSGDERYFVAVADNTLWMIEMASGAVMATVRTGVEEPAALAVTRHGDEVAIVGEDWAPRRVRLVVGGGGAGTLDELWEKMASSDAALAYRAGWVMTGQGDEAVRFLARKVGTPRPADARRIEAWIRSLDSDDFDERNEAERQLARQRWLAAPALARCCNSRPSLDRYLRADRLLRATFALNGAELQQVRAVAVLERIGTPGAAAVLRRVAAGPESPLVDEAKAALTRMGRDERRER